MSFNWNEDECFIADLYCSSAWATTKWVVQTQAHENVLAECVSSPWFFYLDAHKFQIKFQSTSASERRVLRFLFCTSSNWNMFLVIYFRFINGGAIMLFFTAEIMNWD